MKPRIPSSTNDAGVSPGCTLEETNIVGLSKIKGLESDYFSLSGNNPSINASLSSVILDLPVMVSISMGLFSLL